MNNDLHNIEELFRSSLNENEEEIPSKNVWQVIDKQLDKNNAISIKRKYIFLKRIAILLLLLLSIALFELNTSYKNNDRLAKNTGEEPESKSSKKTDKDKYNITKLNAVTAMSNASDNTDKKQNIAVENSFYANNKKQINRKRIVTTNNHALQTQNSTEKVTIEKDNSYKQSSGIFARKKKINIGLAYHTKIKNFTPTEDEQLLVQNNVEDHIFPSLRNRNKVSFKTLQMQSRDSINTKKYPHPYLH